MKAAFGAGVKAAFAKIGKTAESIGTEVNGWHIGAAAGSREFYNGDWALRAAAAKLGIYGNSEAEAVYPFTQHDANGIVADGSSTPTRSPSRPASCRRSTRSGRSRCTTRARSC